MTDEQIVRFIEHRAELAGASNGLHNPKFVIYQSTTGLYPSVMYDNNRQPFLIRFMNNSTRGMFKLKIQDPDFDVWKQKNKNKSIIDYVLNDIPNCIKHHISYAIIEALKTKGYGFDLFCITFQNDLILINQNETYEEVSIEADLMC